MPSVIALVDADAFYCSCEALFNRAIGERPMIVLGNNDRCVVSRNRAAKALDIKVGTPLFHLQHRIQRFHVVVRSSNYALYADLSRRMMTVLSSFSPCVEPYSIDEAWLDLSAVPADALPSYGHQIKQAVMRRVGLPVSIGIASTKVLAKVACETAKTTRGGSGVLSLLGWSEPDLDTLLSQLLAQDLWMIGKASARCLQHHGILTARTLKAADDRWIRRLVGVVGQRVVLELRGISCLPVESMPKPRQGIGVSLAFHRPIEALGELEEAISHYTARAAEKLRRQHQQAGHISVFLQTNPFARKQPQYARSAQQRLLLPTAFSPHLMHIARQLLAGIYQPGYQYHRVGVHLSHLSPETVLQPDLFGEFCWEAHAREARLIAVVDLVNSFLGRDTLIWGAQGLERSWFVHRERLSPAVTTRWSQLAQVQA